MRSVYFFLTTLLVFALALFFFQGTKSIQRPQVAQDSSQLSPLQQLGKHLFFDELLSNPAGVSCATCHSPQYAFSDPRNTPFSVGATGIMGLRNAPMLAYSAFSPAQYFDEEEQTFVGGYFWDGRAATIEGQIAGPLFSHIEMNLGSKAELLQKISQSPYRDLFVYVFGEVALRDTVFGFNAALSAIARYEESVEMNPFTSKYDYYLKGKVQLSDLEYRGLQLFNDPKKGNCAACHPSTPDAIVGKVLFTDFTYDNLGLPAHPLHASKGLKVDTGIGAVVNDNEHGGKFKVPTLRNVAISAPYFHNGVITSLNDAIQFYNKRDLGTFGKPEVEANINTDELGDLKLTDAEVAAIEAFLRTLTDGYQPHNP
jgi:cytochrome c peroxidase